MAKDDWKKEAEEQLRQENQVSLLEEQRKDDEQRLTQAYYLEWHSSYYKCGFCGKSSSEYKTDHKSVETGIDFSDIDNYHYHIYPTDLRVCVSCGSWVCDDCSIWVNNNFLICRACFKRGVRIVEKMRNKFNSIPPIPLFTSEALSLQQYTDVVRGKRQLKDVYKEKGIYHPANRAWYEKLWEWLIG